MFTLRRGVHTVLAYLSMGFMTIFAFVPITCAGLLGRPAIADWFIRLWSRSLLAAFGVRYGIVGGENAAGLGPCVIMSSHRSHLDGPILLCTLPLDFAFVIKRSLSRIPLWGWAVTRAGYVAIDRRRRGSAMVGMSKAAREIRAGRRILTFPEGTRSPSDEFMPFKKGGAVLAIEAQVPVLPVAVAGTVQLLPKGALTARTGKAMVVVGRPIPTEGMTYEDRDTLLATVEVEIRRLYSKGLAALQEA